MYRYNTSLNDPALHSLKSDGLLMESDGLIKVNLIRRDYE